LLAVADALPSNSVAPFVEMTIFVLRFATRKARRRQNSKQRLSSKHVKTQRPVYWLLVDSVFTHLHEQLSSTLEGRADNEGLNALCTGTYPNALYPPQFRR
jgi:hypothetical protein